MSEFNGNEPAIAKYEKILPRYQRLAKEVQDILEVKFAEMAFAPVAVTHRPKTIDSFADKISRKQYTDPLSQMTDLAGVRVVCTYESELADAAKTIETNFLVHEPIDKSRDLGVDRMGYRGKAFVVSLGKSYAGGRYDNITDLKCEIQVRTILQDAWAIISHKLVYKNEESIPEHIRRDVNKVALLLEIAQTIFDSVNEKRTVYLGEIQRKEENPSDFLAQPLDLDTVMAYARRKYPDLEASEKITQLLLSDINLKKYTTLRHLNDVVDRARPAVEAYQKENPDWFETGTDFLTKSLGFIDQEFRTKHAFGQKTRIAFEKFESLISVDK